MDMITTPTETPTPTATEIVEDASQKKPQDPGAQTAPKPDETAASKTALEELFSKKAPVEGEEEEPTSESARFAALTKKERIAFKKIQESKAKEAELSAREERLKEREAQFERAKNDPEEALKLFGFTYQDATEFKLNRDKGTPEKDIRSIRQELSEWKKQQEEKEQKSLKDAEEQAQQEQQERIAQFQEQIHDFVETHPDDYEFIQLHSQEELIFATMQQWYNVHKKSLTIKEAADMVEVFLEDKVQKSLETKKWKTKYSKKEEPKKESKKESEPTLNNSMTSSTPSPWVSAATEEDRIKRALAALG